MDLPGAPTQRRSSPSAAPRDDRLARTSDVARAIITEVERSVVGKRDVLELVLCGLQPEVAEIFTISHLMNYFRIAQTPQQALARMTAGAR